MSKIHTKLLPWFRQHGRHNLPWQIAKTPYTVWISEIMLQQTQVSTVIPYYLKFIQRFPSVDALSLAKQDTVLAHWSGLGYYSRARNLHKTAQIIHEQYDGIFPNTLAALLALPGIGESTAAAILSLAFNQPYAILDGNVKRVLCRYYGITAYPEDVKKQLWELAKENISQDHPADYSQAIMDLGALICTKKPDCLQCPLQKECQAYRSNQTLTLPTKKPKKTIPTRFVYFALIQNAYGAFFLEKRPAKGIWGGLWSCIEAENQNELERRIRTLPLETAFIKTLPLFKHTFTHYHLRITPILYHAFSHHQDLLDSQIWYHSEQNELYGLAKPVTKLMEQALDLSSETDV